MREAKATGTKLDLSPIAHGNSACMRDINFFHTLGPSHAFLALQSVVCAAAAVNTQIRTPPSRLVMAIRVVVVIVVVAVAVIVVVVVVAVVEVASSS